MTTYPQSLISAVRRVRDAYEAPAYMAWVRRERALAVHTPTDEEYLDAEIAERDAREIVDAAKADLDREIDAYRASRTA